MQVLAQTENVISFARMQAMMGLPLGSPALMVSTIDVSNGEWRREANQWRLWKKQAAVEPEPEPALPEIREFPTLVVASLTSKMLLCDKFSDMVYFAEFLEGRPIFDATLANRAFVERHCQTVLKQHPGLPTEPPPDCDRACLDLEEKFGKTIMVARA